MKNDRAITGEKMNRELYDKLLLSKGCVLEAEVSDENAFYYAAYIVNKFGAILDKPLKINAETVMSFSMFFSVSVPDSFYENPQDTKHYSCRELELEQYLSYLRADVEGKRSSDPETFKRMELFGKELYNYNLGVETVVRRYNVVSKEEADDVIKESMKSYCAYTRPWSVNERDEFVIMYNNGYYDGSKIECKDNLIECYVATGNKDFAEGLDYKDVVKMSELKLDEGDGFKMSDELKALFVYAINNANPCPLTKKQAKYFNKIIKLTGIKFEKQNNSQSPYAVSKKLVAHGKVVEAAKYLSGCGSMLERSLVWLLSRADKSEVNDILALVGNGNPIVCMQLLWKLVEKDDKGRVFRFTKNNTAKYHEENAEECKNRRSLLSDDIREKAAETMKNKLVGYYKAHKLNGRIYVSEAFKKVFVPVNTSASGKGIGVLPCGSRMPVKYDYIRTFCYWNDIFDIDASMVFINDNNKKEELSWRTYSFKNLGDSALTSGDCMAKDGAEYQDFAVGELKERGWKYGVYFINGYEDKLNQGEIYCGYQNKADINTKAWMPNNIETKIQVVGDSRQFIGFAIDFDEKEVVVINRMTKSNSSVVNARDIEAIKFYLNKDFIRAWNMYDLLTSRGETVDAPEKADMVFDADYEGKAGQKVIRPWDVESLIKLII